MHKPVFIKESLEYLLQSPQGHYLDATFGRGGHARAILEQIQTPGSLLACDRDLTAVQSAQSLQEAHGGCFNIVHANYSEIFSHIQLHSLDGILADLGVCSAQIDQADRGFSFQRSGPLDMRMNQTEKSSLWEFLLDHSEKELAGFLSHYGEERHAKLIAKNIKERQKKGLLKTTQDLAQCAQDAYPDSCQETKHPATRTFQALRIALNDEFTHLKSFLDQLPLFLKDGGRAVIITFHSLEYTLVKDHYQELLYAFRHGESSVAMKKIAHPLFPSQKELRSNPRSRSARLHIYEKITSVLTPHQDDLLES